MNLCIATIVSGNYLAYAKTLSESITLQMPSTQFKVLIVDLPTEELNIEILESNLDVTFAKDLNIHDINLIAYKYDIVEFNTALKPTFLKKLFSEGYKNVIYLDPDIYLYSPLTSVLEALQSSEIVLIPHALTPALDGKRPSDVDFLRNGSFNLGFIGLKASAQVTKMLDWWESRCLNLGFSDTGFGTFVDQKWIDLVPSYFTGVHILKDETCNVAYWNLHERDITSDLNSRYLVNNSPLTFFHFSGVSPSRPDLLSKHQSRHFLIEGTPLSRLVGSYCNALIVQGHNKISKIPYGYARLDDGTPISWVMRRAAVIWNKPLLNPFSAHSEFQKCLRSSGISQNSTKNNNIRSISTLNFDQSGLKVRGMNFLIKTAAKIIGVNNFLLVLRYCALMTRESHYAAVLLNRELDMIHRMRR